MASNNDPIEIVIRINSEGQILIGDTSGPEILRVYNCVFVAFKDAAKTRSDFQELKEWMDEDTNEGDRGVARKILQLADHDNDNIYWDLLTDRNDKARKVVLAVKFRWPECQDGGEYNPKPLEGLNKNNTLPKNLFGQPWINPTATDDEWGKPDTL